MVGRLKQYKNGKEEDKTRKILDCWWLTGNNPVCSTLRGFVDERDWRDFER